MSMISKEIVYHEINIHKIKYHQGNYLIE